MIKSDESLLPSFRKDDYSLPFQQLLQKVGHQINNNKGFHSLISPKTHQANAYHLVVPPRVNRSVFPPRVNYSFRLFSQHTKKQAPLRVQSYSKCLTQPTSTDLQKKPNHRLLFSKHKRSPQFNEAEAGKFSNIESLIRAKKAKKTSYRVREQMEKEGKWRKDLDMRKGKERRRQRQILKSILTSSQRDGERPFLEPWDMSTGTELED